MDKLGADIGFEDEAGVGIMARHGWIWGLKGKTPVVKASMQIGVYHLLSTMTAQRDRIYVIIDDTINAERYIEFLKEVISNREHPLILLVDHVTFHGSKEVRMFARAYRCKLITLFFPKRSQAFNPDEHVLNEIKNSIGKQPVKNKAYLKERLAFF